MGALTWRSGMVRAKKMVSTQEQTRVTVVAAALLTGPAKSNKSGQNLGRVKPQSVWVKGGRMDTPTKESWTIGTVHLGGGHSRSVCSDRISRSRSTQIRLS